MSVVFSLQQELLRALPVSPLAAFLLRPFVHELPGHSLFLEEGVISLPLRWSMLDHEESESSFYDILLISNVLNKKEAGFDNSDHSEVLLFELWISQLPDAFSFLPTFCAPYMRAVVFLCARLTIGNRVYLDLPQ